MEIINKIVKKEWTFEEIPIGSVFSVSVNCDEKEFFYIKIDENAGFYLHSNGEVETFTKGEEINYYPKAKLIIE